MTALVGVELRRLASRRAARRGAVVLFVGLLAAPVLVPWAYHEQARIERDADVEDCVAAARGAPGQREARCEATTPMGDRTFHLRQLDEVLRTTAALLIIAAFLVGASSIGADWQAGVVATVLTWESRRWRVFGARLLALTGTVLVVVALWQLVLGAVLTPLALAQDATDATGGTWLRGVTGLGLRISLVAAGAAGLGFALATAGRSTAMALGAGFAYFFVFENVVGSQFEPLRPWLVLWNAIVFAKGQYEAGGDVPGRTVTAAAAILAVWAAAAVTLAGAHFRRRDVG
jgi:ABC-2 type transport system permease protein